LENIMSSPIAAHSTEATSAPESLQIAVLTISDTRTHATDSSGQTLVDLLEADGHRLAARAIVHDDIWQIRERLCSWINDPSIQVVLMTGGTGFTLRDITPQAVAPLLERVVDGFGERFRQVSLADIGNSTMQSRALAGISNGTLICCLPGSTNACRTAWQELLSGQLDSRTRPCNFVPHLRDTRAAVCETRG
jgi:molybdenum cofactor biosynthesis protein B